MQQVNPVYREHIRPIHAVSPVTHKDAERAELSAQVSEFLELGGEIQRLPFGVMRDKDGKASFDWNERGKGDRDRRKAALTQAACSNAKCVKAIAMLREGKSLAVIATLLDVNYATLGQRLRRDYAEAYKQVRRGPVFV